MYVVYFIKMYVWILFLFNITNKTKYIIGTERISENMHIIANEPSLAFYRLQEHVRKAMPGMVQKRVEVTALHQDLQGCCYDVEYALR